MKKIVILVIAIVALSCLQAEWVSVENGSSSLFECVSSNRANTELHFSLDGYELETVEKEGTVYTKISHPDQGFILEIGKPELPVFTTLVAISGTGNPQINYRAGAKEVIEGVVPFPQQELQLESEPYDEEFTIDNDFYRSAEMFPLQNVVLGEPVIMRDVRLVAVTIQPFQYNPLTNQLEIIHSIDVEITMDSEEGINELAERSAISKAFQPFYKDHIINYELTETRDEFQQPCILFIYPNNNQVAQYLAYLEDWKHQKGFEVHSVSTSQTGSTNSQIKNYIQNAYNSWENRPDYIVLVGDAGGTYNIPTWIDSWSWYNGEGDQPYAQLAGNDVLADAIVGRLPFGSISELQTMISKTYNYELYPFVDEPEWMQTFTLVGDPSASGPSTISTCRYVQEISQAHNPNFEYNEIFSGGYSTQMSAALNSGTLYFCYRGYIGMSGFGTTEINNLNNGWMLPFASVLTCGTGGFTGTCRSEVFARAGSTTNPKGAIAAVGTATSGTHTCFNNCVTAGMFEGIFNLGIYTPGGALVNGKLNLFLNYPQNPSNYVDIFSHWNNLMGDPSVALYTDLPEEMFVEYPAEIGAGAEHILVTVTDHTGSPVEDAWATILKGDDVLFATGYTNEDGQIWLPLEEGVTGDVTLTVTGHNMIAFQDEFNIVNQNVQLNPRNFNIDDDSFGSSNGNNNSIVNNGETIELDVLLDNSGSQTATSVTAQLDCSNSLVNITTANVSYPNITAGNEVGPNSSFVVEFDPSITGGTVIQFVVNISAGIQQFSDIIEIEVEAPALSFDDYTLIGTGAVIDPGETAELEVTIENLGQVASGALTGVLSSDDSFISIGDPNGSCSSIFAGGTGTFGTNNFEITINSMAIPGNQIPLMLEVSNADGFTQTIGFVLEVGTVSVDTPLGPDSYGYLCYDESDTEYLECPEYDWIELNPSQGGNGTQLSLSTSGDDCDIEDVDFPGGFSFSYYGESYNMFTVGTAGWIAPGGTQVRSFMNWHIPEAHGPSPMIAVFWDDLLNGSGHVYTYYNSSLHYYVVQWDNFQNEYDDSEETFQVILYDANYYPTSTGDSMIKMQYKVFNNNNSGIYRADHGQYCTIGLEDQTGLVGLEYTFNNTYPTAAQQLDDETAIMFTTLPIPPDGAYLTIGNMVLNDENGNGTADYGEYIEIEIMLNNIGSENANGVSLEISSSDQYITLGNTVSSYPNIANGTMEANLTPFTITIDDVVPDGHLAPLILSISSTEDTWELFTQIELNAPDLNFLDYMVNDGEDNILDPGETADILVNFTNLGGAPVYDAEITLTTNDPYLTIDNGTYSPGNIPGDATVAGIYEFSAGINSPQGHAAVVNWTLDAGMNYTSSGSFEFVISQVPVLIDEDFSGNFPPDGWYMDGQNWGSGSSNNAGGAAPEAKFNWSPSVNGEQRLVCGPFSTSGSSELDLSFRQNVNHYSSTYDLLLETSTNGSTWHQAASWPAQNQSATVSNVNITTSDVGSSTFYMAFTFSGNSYNINYWYIDDVHLEGINTQPMGYIQGLVSIGGTGNVTDVDITVADQTVHPNSSGEYGIIIPPGIYTLTASLEGYDNFIAEGVEVIATEITQQDVVLGFIPSPENLSAFAQEDGVMLSWTLSSEQRISRDRDIDYYNIYFSFNGSGYDLAGTATEMTYLHQPYLPGSYQYYVTAHYTESGETLPSNSAGAWYGGEIHFGDINESYDTGAYDAALILQYFVGLDPIPEQDPRPWEEWRLYLGDVDGNSVMETFDASLILQFYVGLIDQFPVEPQPVMRSREKAEASKID